MNANDIIERLCILQSEVAGHLGKSKLTTKKVCSANHYFNAVKKPPLVKPPAKTVERLLINMTTWNLNKICTCGIKNQPCERHIYDNKLCERCGKNPASDLYNCPYQSELSGDNSDDYCNCCDECTVRCFKDI